MAVVMESNRDRDRPHSHPIRTLSHSNSNTNPNTSNEHQHQQQLFLCFTSRLSSSSSSMKISKSILSPGRSAREISLSSSLSRRLKTNGSLKGGQSPMFPVTTTASTATRKKTGAGFENPEPSSPKVTCIGQVRVKSKKKKTNHQHHHSSNGNIRSRSQRRSSDYSFRRIDAVATEDGNNGLKRQSSTSYRNREIELESSQRHGHNNQKWVHIPVTICDSLKSFGSDFNCFHPCRSSTCISDKERRQQREAEKHLGCGSVLARWLVAVQGDGEGGVKEGRQIELVVGGGDDDEVCGRRSYRKRHVMEDIDIKEIERNLKEKVESWSQRDGIVEGGRASICVPPKNALLLMRCGSDPLKMSALANRFWEPPEKVEEEEEEKEIHEIDEQQTQMLLSVKDVGEACSECECDTEHTETTILVPESDEQNCIDESIPSEPEMIDEDEVISCDKFVTEVIYHDVLEEEFSRADMELAVTGLEEVEDNEGMEVPIEHRNSHERAERDSGANETMDNSVEEMMDNEVDEFEEADQLVTTSPSSEQGQEECGGIVLTEQEQGKKDDSYGEDESENDLNASEEKQDISPAEKKESSALPDCLLLMMCEPKLSMEVSQETWVCTTDFIRWLPPREVNKTATTNKKMEGGRGGAAHRGGDELSKRVSIHYKPPTAPPRKSQENPQIIPPRSSCSYPAPPAKQESVYNLTRCKSEPRRTAAKSAAAGTADSCFWKNKPNAPVGVGAAGMGF